MANPIQYRHEQFFECCAIGRDEKNVLYIRTHGGRKEGVQLVRIKPSEEQIIAKHFGIRVDEPEFKPAKPQYLAVRPARKKIMGYLMPKADIIKRLPAPEQPTQPVRVRRLILDPKPVVRVRKKIM